MIIFTYISMSKTPINFFLLNIKKSEILKIEQENKPSKALIIWQLFDKRKTARGIIS